jgi:hypothetical protein
MITTDLDHGLHGVRRAQRTGQGGRHTEPGDGERLDQSFAECQPSRNSPISAFFRHVIP